MERGKDAKEGRRLGRMDGRRITLLNLVAWRTGMGCGGRGDRCNEGMRYGRKMGGRQGVTEGGREETMFNWLHLAQEGIENGEGKREGGREGGRKRGMDERGAGERRKEGGE